MKRILIACLLSCIYFSINAQTVKHCDPEKEKLTKAANNSGSYGATITKENCIPASELAKSMQGKKEQNLKIEGTVKDVCHVKGCWMETDLGNGKSMRITFKDYAFFVPKNCAGKSFYAQGKANWDTTSVAMLQHYAEDAGKSKKEIDTIKEPIVELIFVADGVLFDEKKP